MHCHGDRGGALTVFVKLFAFFFFLLTFPISSSCFRFLPHCAQVDTANAEIQRLVQEKQQGGSYVTFGGPQAKGPNAVPSGGRNAAYPDPYAQGAPQHGGYGQQPPQAAWGAQQPAYGAYPQQGCVFVVGVGWGIFKEKLCSDKRVRPRF